MALTDNILAYWKLDNDGSGAVSLLDSTGNGNALTDNGGATLGTGIIAGASEFNGNSYLTKTFATTESQFSVSFWFKYNSYNVGNSTICGGDGVIVYTDGADFRVFSQDFGATPLAPFDTGDWHHFVATYNGTDYSTYFDGALSLTTTQSSTFSSINLGSFGGSQIADGLTDEVGVWNRALSLAEVTELYNGGEGLTYPFVPPVYFNAAVNGNLATLGNWWQDSGFTIPAVSLPTSTDFVVISAPVTIGTGTYGGASINANIGSAVTITASSISVLGGINSGTLVGSTTLLNSASNAGAITGNATLRNSSTNSGTISGNATVYYDNGDGTKPIGGIVTGTITYLGFPIKKAWFSSAASGTSDGNFNTIANWWLDSQLTIPANEIPSEITDIVVVSFMNSVSGSPVVNSITIPSGGSVEYIALTATNGVYITGGSTLSATFYTSGGSVGEDSVGFISRLLKLPWFINI